MKKNKFIYNITDQLAEWTKLSIFTLQKSRFFALPLKYFIKVAIYILQTKGSVVVDYSDPQRQYIIQLIEQIKKERKMLLRNNEAYQIYIAVKSTEKIKGEIAEVGVFQGGSAKLICEAKGNKIVNLFDTFQGLPEVSDIDQNLFYEGQYTAPLDNVRDYLKNYQGVNFVQGIFPDSAEDFKNTKFSFVHLDVDTYISTLNSLEFFYSRMSKGGIIISHDYLAPGIKKAFDVFFSDKNEPVIEISGGNQCMVIKI